ncbi:LON peptidase substrate-binding domain-containing protein [bacterium]|nr:LON peptidase substrate-binding domain-containing protein [bacterium]
MDKKKDKYFKKEEAPLTDMLPMIPVRDLVTCPYLVSPILVGRPASIRSLEAAQEKDKLIFICTQRREQTEDPKQKDLYPVGTVARILQILRQDETVSILVEGLECGRLLKLVNRPFNQALIERREPESDMPETEMLGMRRAAFQLFSDYVSKNPRLSDELVRSLSGETDSRKFFYLVIGNLLVRNDEKMKLLECDSLRNGFRLLCEILSREIELLNVEHKILGEVRHRIDEQQKSYFLNEQIRAIEKELGKKAYSEADDYTSLFAKTNLPGNVRDAAERNCRSLTTWRPSARNPPW